MPVVGGIVLQLKVGLEIVLGKISKVCVSRLLTTNIKIIVFLSFFRVSSALKEGFSQYTGWYAELLILLGLITNGPHALSTDGIRITLLNARKSRKKLMKSS